MTLEEFVARGQAAQKAVDDLTATLRKKGCKVSSQTIVSFLMRGICLVCGCTDDDCSQCIEKTGEPCTWANKEHTFCSACVENFSGSASSDKPGVDNKRMAATAEEGTAPKTVQVNAEANVRRSNSGNVKSGVTAWRAQALP